MKLQIPYQKMEEKNMVFLEKINFLKRKREQTLAIRMKTTKRGNPSSSILGKGGGAALPYWRAAIPFFPLASTTNCPKFLCFFWVVVLVEKKECLTNESSRVVLELEIGNLIKGFKDIATSIFSPNFSLYSICSQNLCFKVYRNEFLDENGGISPSSDTLEVDEATNHYPNCMGHFGPWLSLSSIH